MKTHFNSIFARIFFATFSICALVVLSGAAISYSLLVRSVERNTERLLADSVAMLAANIDAGIPPSSLAAAIKKYAGECGIRTTIIAADGTIVLDSSADNSSMLNHLDRLEVKTAFDGKMGVSKRYSQTLRSKMVYIASPAGRGENAKPLYCVRQSIDLQIPEARKGILKTQVAVFSFAAIAASVLLSLLTARGISIPLKALAETAAKYADEDFAARVPDSRIDEIRMLALSLSKMGRDLRKRINSLHKRNCELDEVLSQMRDCVFICSDDGEVRRYNRACSEIFVFPEDSRNPRVAGVFRNTSIIAAVSRTFKTSKPVSDDFEYCDKTYRILGFPLPYEAKHMRALFVIRDISEERKTELLRREFVAGVSHELKTPITSIKMAASTIAENYDSKTAERFIPTIEREADRMTALVNDMLLLSKIEFSRAGENFKSFNLSDIVKLAVSNNENQIVRNGVVVENLCPATLEMKGDPTLVQIAVSNLVSNAVRYGGAECRITISAKDTGEFLSLTVADTGVGISKENLGRVFERFFRVDKGRSRALGGTGLGLALVKHIAILHGGGVSAESELGKGSRFTIAFKKA